MHDNMNRIYEDVAWFIEKYDYKNKDADWKNSKDAIQRGMQKLCGSDPSLPPHVLKNKITRYSAGRLVAVQNTG